MAPLENLHARYCRFIHRAADKIRLTDCPVATQLLAEALGTLLLVLYGDGGVAAAFLGSKQVSQFAIVSLGFGAGLTASVLVVGKACPAALNPGIALANTVTGRLHWFLLPATILAEVLGGYLAAGLLLAVHNAKIADYALRNDGGRFLVNTTGGIFVANRASSLGTAVTDQIVTTALLVFGIYAVTEARLTEKHPHATPAYVGVILFLCIGTYTANAGSALNSARDLGPRLMLLSTYWGVSAFTTDNYYFWVPLCMPMVGAVVGGILYELLIGAHSDREIVAEEYF